MNGGFSSASVFARVMALDTLTFLQLVVVNATPTFLDGFGRNFAHMKMKMPRCACSEDFPVRRFLQELWPLTLTFSHVFLVNATPTCLG
jgi:hypothetical protein